MSNPMFPEPPPAGIEKLVYTMPRMAFLSFLGATVFGMAANFSDANLYTKPFQEALFNYGILFSVADIGIMVVSGYLQTLKQLPLREQKVVYTTLLANRLESAIMLGAGTSLMMLTRAKELGILSSMP